MILGSFLLFYGNLNLLMERLQNQLEVNFYLNDDLSENELRQLVTTLKTDPRVRDFEILNKHEALQLLKKELGEDSELLENLGENPLPNSISVKLNPVDNIREFRESFEKLPTVQESSSGKDWVEKLVKIITLCKKAGFAIVILLGLASLSIISNTIRLTVFARRQEIEIMRLVGATNWFIRIPFLLEGMLQGIIGSLIAIIFLAVGYSIFMDKISLLFPDILMLSHLGELVQLYSKLLLLGIALGLLGSLLSLRRFLV
jgi:cell division transport system permease protein